MQVWDGVDIHQAPGNETLSPSHDHRISQVVGRTGPENQVPVRNEKRLERQQGQHRGETCHPDLAVQGCLQVSLANQMAGQKHEPHGQADQADCPTESYQ